MLFLKHERNETTSRNPGRPDGNVLGWKSGLQRTLLNAVEATRHIRQWSHLGFTEAAAIWSFREELMMD